jgi:hypothetical protein
LAINLKHFILGVPAAGAGGFIAGGGSPTANITSNGGGEDATVPVTAPTTDVTTVVGDGTPPITYALNGGKDHRLFTIDAATGVLTFIGASVAGTYVVGVRATNSWTSLSARQTITVVVT